MPIEIRELVIKTTIDSSVEDSTKHQQVSAEAFERMRRSIMQQCKSYIDQKIKEDKER